MHLLDINCHFSFTQAQQDDSHPFLKFFGLLAPLLSVIASIASLYLAYTVFRYTRQKNDNDVKIKWFQELVYTPNKDTINAYFQNLYSIQNQVSGKVLSDQDKIDIMNVIKAERQTLFTSFVDVIKPISPKTHTSISIAIDELTDRLTNAFDNDMLDMQNPQVYTASVTTPISQTRNSLIIALFNYKG